jgi:translation initiation factor IF-1
VVELQDSRLKFKTCLESFYLAPLEVKEVELRLKVEVFLWVAHDRDTLALVSGVLRLAALEVLSGDKVCVFVEDYDGSGFREVGNNKGKVDDLSE